MAPEIEKDSIAGQIERSSLQTKLSLALGALGILMTLIQFFMTREITSTSNKLDTLNQSLIKLNTTVEIQQMEGNYTKERVAKLEKAKEDAATAHERIDQRLNSLEQRAVIAEQFMQNTKYK